MQKENKELEEISMEELLPVAARLAGEYLGCDHTSMRWEKAQMLMEAVLYCIAQASDGEEEKLTVQGRSAKETYEAGYALVRKKAAWIRTLYHQMLENFEDYGMECLKDTVQKGIPEFLKWYDVKFCPQDTILTLDYPVLTDLTKRTGADAVLEYLKGIYLEQKFLGQFDTEVIRRFLIQYDPEYEKAVENICRILMPCLIGYALQRKWKMEQEGEDGGTRKLREWLLEQTVSGLEDLTRQMLDQFLTRARIQKNEEREYFKELPDEAAVRIYHAAQNDCLERIFLLKELKVC